MCTNDLTFAERSRTEEVRWRDGVQAVVQLTQRPALTADGPGSLAQIVHHGGPVDPLHDKFGLIIGHLMDRGYRVALRRQVRHDPGLMGDRASVARTAQNEVGPVLEDVGVTPGRQLAAQLLHAGEPSGRPGRTSGSRGDRAPPARGTGRHRACNSVAEVRRYGTGVVGPSAATRSDSAPVKFARRDCR